MTELRRSWLISVQSSGFRSDKGRDGNVPCWEGHFLKKPSFIGCLREVVWADFSAFSAISRTETFTEKHIRGGNHPSVKGYKVLKKKIIHSPSMFRSSLFLCALIAIIHAESDQGFCDNCLNDRVSTTCTAKEAPVGTVLACPPDENGNVGMYYPKLQLH